jgi:polysaccharide biosynthesis transport protein
MEDTEEYIDLKQYWLILRRRWLPALIVMSSVTTLTALLTFLQKPVFESTGKVLLKKDSGISSAIQSSGPLAPKQKLLNLHPLCSPSFKQSA